MTPKKLLILTHHHLGPAPAEARYKNLYTLPSHLEKHVRWLQARGFVFRTVSEGLASHEPKVACLSFDDGFLDVFLHGLPLLERLGVPATVYVISGDVGKRGLIWEESGDRAPVDFMTWAQLVVLNDKGWEIGSHAHAHVHLSKKNPDEQGQNIASAAASIEGTLGTAPKSFSYPYGFYNEETISALRRSGFTNAVTTVSGVNGDADSPFELRRLQLKGIRPRHLVASWLKIVVL